MFNDLLVVSWFHTLGIELLSIKTFQVRFFVNNASNEESNLFQTLQNIRILVRILPLFTVLKKNLAWPSMILPFTPIFRATEFRQSVTLA